MKKLMLVLMLGIVTACGSTDSSEGKTDKVAVTPETSEKIKKAQDENIELEEIDGELDSLINSIK